MRVAVDMELCEYHGECALAAPGVFRLVADDELEYDAEFDVALLPAVEEAVRSCPVQAITLTG